MPTSAEAKEWLAHALETDELAHHGVMGQKWGVRHDTTSTPRVSHTPSAAAKTAVKKTVASKSKVKSSSAAKKPVRVSKTKDTHLDPGAVILLGFAGVTGVAYAADGAQKAYGAVGARAKLPGVLKDVKKIQENTAAIDNGKDFLRSKVDTSVPSNTVFHRVSSYAETEVNGPKYATYLQDDVLHYRKTWITPGRTPYHAHFITKMEATKPVTIASPNSIFETLVKNMHTPLPDGESVFQKYVKVNGVITRADQVPDGKIAELIIAHNRRNIWADDVGAATSHLMQKAGYAAVTDINNTGSLSRKHAVIILDKEAFNVSSSKLTQAERSAAGLAKSKLAKAAVKAAASKI